MQEWLAAFFLSFGVIFVAELGDKSQLMALAFAVRYRVLPVLVGITLATSVVHAVSVAVGFGLGAALPTEWILAIGGVAFLAFAVWTLRGDQLSEAESGRATRAGPGGAAAAIWAAFGAFFLAELGDKTMLATITLASQHGWVATWLGSTLGMVAADALVIVLGRLLGRALPERFVRLGATALFVAFGAWLLVDAAGQFAGVRPWQLLAGWLDHHVAGWIALVMALLGGAAAWLVHRSTPPAPARRGPGPCPAPRRRGHFGARMASILHGLAVLLGLAAPLLVAADVLQPIPLLANPGAVVIGAGVMLLGMVLLLAAQVELGQARRGWWRGENRPRLVTRGVHSRVRNPGLTGMVVAMAGTLLMVPTLLAVVATVLLVVAVQIKVRAVREPNLALLFGRDFDEYQERAGRFLPRIGQR